MAKNHDEGKDLRAFSRVGKIDYANKCLKASKNAIIGIKTKGKIDYLTRYCGWVFIWDNSAIPTRVFDDSNKKQEQRAAKKASKEHKLTDKTKKKK